MMMKRVIGALAFALAAAHAIAADVRIPLPDGALVLPVPGGWKPARLVESVPTIALTPAEGDAFHIRLAVQVRSDGSMAPADRESLRKLITSTSQEILPQVVEKTLPVQYLLGGNARGYYFSATDRSEPKPGEFKYMTQGAVSIQGLPVMFTILSNGEGRAAVETAFTMLKTARRQ